MSGPLVISPHFDDAALSAGQTILGLRGVTVATVCTATPPDPDMLTSYDAHCGFASASEAVTERELEDRQAMRVLGVGNVERLGLVDSQYGVTLPRDDLVRAMIDVVNRYDPSGLIGPVGALHPDHIIVTEAILDIIPEIGVPAWLWADLPNVMAEPGSLKDAIARVRSRNFTMTETRLPPGPMERKRGAVRSYRSQLWALRGPHVYVEERLWQIK